MISVTGMRFQDFHTCMRVEDYGQLKDIKLSRAYLFVSDYKYNVLGFSTERSDYIIILIISGILEHRRAYLLI